MSNELIILQSNIRDYKYSKSPCKHGVICGGPNWQNACTHCYLYIFDNWCMGRRFFTSKNIKARPVLT